MQQPSATLSKYAFYSTCSFCLYHLYPIPSRDSLVFIRLVFVFFVALISGGVFCCCALVPGTLALDLPTYLDSLARFVFFLCLTVTTEFVSLYDEESGRTLGVLLMS